MEEKRDEVEEEIKKRDKQGRHQEKEAPRQGEVVKMKKGGVALLNSKVCFMPEGRGILPIEEGIAFW